MKTLVSLVLAGLFASTAVAAVSVQVYRADEQTPLEWADPNVPDVYRDTMVGTHLTLFVVSDAPEPRWSGTLRMTWDDWDVGTVRGREPYDEITRSYEGSVLPAGGQDWYVTSRDTFDGVAINLFLESQGMGGEWFVLDYRAAAPGTCNVAVYADEIRLNDLPVEPGPGEEIWIQDLTFNHVPSQDHNGDTTVDFVDFALWASGWNQTTLPDPNTAVPSDPNEFHTVDVGDLALFCDYWLERTDVNEPVPDPNDPASAS